MYKKKGVVSTNDRVVGCRSTVVGCNDRRSTVAVGRVDVDRSTVVVGRVVRHRCTGVVAGCGDRTQKRCHRFACNRCARRRNHLRLRRRA